MPDLASVTFLITGHINLSNDERREKIAQIVMQTTVARLPIVGKI
jgi:hypothetical protein